MHFSQVLVGLDAQRNHNRNQNNNKINNDNNTTNNHKDCTHMTDRLPTEFSARDEENPPKQVFLLGTAMSHDVHMMRVPFKRMLHPIRDASAASKFLDF